MQWLKHFTGLLTSVYVRDSREILIIKRIQYSLLSVFWLTEIKSYPIDTFLLISNILLHHVSSPWKNTFNQRRELSSESTNNLIIYSICSNYGDPCPDFSLISILPLLLSTPALSLIQTNYKILLIFTLDAAVKNTLSLRASWSSTLDFTNKEWTFFLFEIFLSFQ